ncbi:hypothetical protein L1987_28493 [Smallanthus sonchifolius]|uniref:Uncharacterized protein n=1 Tax=Smallanthus sonchifolius TaxID=185202 RepID=A0ACB9HYJ5_9ASTR|nr:hypothetical protein L1987_28493 [Smallanthus sonchifolius]
MYYPFYSISYFRLNLYILDHIRNLGMHQTAEVFSREAGISEADSGLNLPDNFLSDWWSIFWDSYNLMMHARASGGEDMPESSAQAEALAQTQAAVQVQAQAQAEAHPQTQALVHASYQVQHQPQAEALPQTQAQAHASYQVQHQPQTQAQAQAQAEIQVQAWTLANNGMLCYEPYGNAFGQIWAQQYSVNNANMVSEPILAFTWNDEQYGVLPGYINAAFHPGWAFPSSNPRLTTDQISRMSRRRANRSGSRTGTSNASKSA